MSQIENMKDRMLEELREKLKIEFTGKLSPLMQAQDEFFSQQQTQLKQWNRARTDIQLYFNELKKRDQQKDEYLAVSEAVEMLIDLFKVEIHKDQKELQGRSQAELNQIRYSIIDKINKKMDKVRQLIKSTLANSKTSDGLFNLNKYKTVDTIFDQNKHREALIDAIQTKYLTPIFAIMDSD